jgi:hypothetical protein
MALITIAQARERVELEKARKLAKRRKFQGLDISVETAKGSYRHWYDPHAGEGGKTKLLHDYGYVRGSVGADGDHVDCYVGPNQHAANAFVVDQMKKPAFVEFDEQKVMLGFDTEAQARKAYLACYNDPRFLGTIRTVPMADFKAQVLTTSEFSPLVRSEQQGGENGGGPVDAHGAQRNHFPRLFALSESLRKGERPPKGYAVIPGGKKGGYRKKVGKGWSYWYPTAGEKGEGGRHAAAEYSEDDFAAGNFDKVPGNWHFIRAGKGKTDIHAWTVGGIDPHSKHPVKRAGMTGRLFQIVDPEPAGHPGWALLRDVNRPREDATLVQHNRVYPVEHSRHGEKRKKLVVTPPPGGPGTGGGRRGGPRRWEEGEDPTKPRPAAPTGWVVGSEVRIQPYPDSRAKKGTMLHRVERGHYPRKSRRRWEADLDGVPRKEKSEVLFMPEGDKVLLLGEMQGLVRKSADRARRKLGVKKNQAVMEDLHSAAMEGLLHAIDNYKGGYSFAKSAATYAEQHARLHAAREFAGGFGMSHTEQRMMPGFLAARAEANRVTGGDADAPTIARLWRLRKRDRHRSLKEGKNDPIPLGDYSLKAGEIVTGKDNPGKLKMAQEFVEFLDGQKGHVDIGDDATTPLLPGAGTGYGMGTTERLEATHDLSVALETVEKFDAVIGRRVYRVNAADVLRRRLGLGMEPQSVRGIADSVPIYRIAQGGDLKQLSPRAAFDALGPTIEQALDSIRGGLEAEAAGLIERAHANLVEPPVASRGPTMRQRIEADSRKVTRDDIRAWRSSERTRLRKLEARYRADGDDERGDNAKRMRERIKLVGRKEASRHIAEQRVLLRPRSREWFRNAIARPVDFQDPRNEYGSATITMTDLGTGKQRQVKIRTVRDFAGGDEAYKSDADPGTVPDMDTLRMITLFPRLSHTLWGSDDPLAFAPSVQRAAVLEAMGF